MAHKTSRPPAARTPSASVAHKHLSSAKQRPTDPATLKLSPEEIKRLAAVLKQMLKE